MVIRIHPHIVCRSACGARQLFLSGRARDARRAGHGGRAPSTHAREPRTTNATRRTTHGGRGAQTPTNCSRRHARDSRPRVTCACDAARRYLKQHTHVTLRKRTCMTFDGSLRREHMPDLRGKSMEDLYLSSGFAPCRRPPRLSGRATSICVSVFANVRTCTSAL